MKILFSDVDGTLMRHYGEVYTVSEEDRLAIERFQKAGNRFVIASGRLSPSLLEDLKKLNIHCDVIASGGAATFHSGELSKSYTIPIDVVLKAFEISEKECSQVFFRCGSEMKRKFYFFRGQNGDDSESFIKEISQEMSFNKLSIAFPTNEILLRAKKRLKEKLGTKLNIVESMPTNLDVTYYGIHKGFAIEEYLAEYKNKELTVAGIGDGLNDLEIMNHVQIRFAVADGEEELKKQVDYVVQSVAEAINRLM